MTEDSKIKRVIEDIVEDEMRGCVMCNSHVDLIYCELESYITKKSLSLLCYSCRQEYLFDDEGFVDEEKLDQLFDEALKYEDDEDDEDDDF